MISKKILFLYFFILFCMCTKGQSQDLAPNILLILVDDLGYGDLGVYNSESLIPTKNLDKLANMGMTFTNAYNPSPVCSPTRYAIMTGQYPWKSWKKAGVMANYEPSMIADSLITLPEKLQQYNYHTVGYGKWHLGTQFPTLDGQKPIGYGKFKHDENGKNIDVLQPVFDGPLDHGFEEWFGFSCASEGWILENNQIDAILDHDLYSVKAAKNIQHLEKIDLNTFLYRITDKTVDFLDQNKNRKQPFFLYYSPYVPHIPLAVHEDFQGHTEAGLYGDYVYELDLQIGRIIDKLQETGLIENTIVIFASDNGSQFEFTSKYISPDQSNSPGGMKPIKNQDYPLHYPNGNLRGTKWSIYNGGLRSPLIVVWKGKIPQGERNTSFFCNLDVYPTLIHILDNKQPSIYDGNSQLKSLYSSKAGKRKRMYARAGSHQFALIEDKWKLIAKSMNSELAYELYNLKNDPQEKKNMYSENPKIAKKLKMKLLEHFDLDR